MRFFIASGNLALEPCASTTFKPCKKKFYISYTSSMKVVTRSLLSFFPSNVFFIKFQLRAAISRWNHALAQHSTIVKRRFIHSYIKVVRRSLVSLFTII